MTKTPCGFCRSTKRQITNEHIFGEWLGPLFGVGDGKTRVRHTFQLDDGPIRAWTPLRIDQRVKMPCKRCNDGWMNRLETAVRPVITPMIRGRRTFVGLSDQVAITMWALKTAMVAEYLRTHVRYFEPRERTHLRRSARPARNLGARVWVGCYGGPNPGFHALTGTLTYGPGLIAAHTSAFALGHFLVQLLVERRTARNVDELFSRPGPWTEALVQIWPPDPEMAQGGAAWLWPPVPLSHKGFHALFDRFLGFSGQRGPYRPNKAP